MLKALELVGFKSFADRTRFEFPEGITVVVGPNGSGKSNIVDAIRWVLGAQSAKSLRGADMVDVIFKGSEAGGRKAANSAEATLVFDNADKKLAVDATEVQVTRRVYRNGDSEYLINAAPCRLRDIKDLFRGTGVGVDAYSLIEQGKVDRMLQASPKDRRAIFEEAAGISRFKSKKVEAERRLARVDQNLLRLKDLVDEVRTRLTTLQNQAEKARRYREMVQRLGLIRAQLGFADVATILGKKSKIAQLVDDINDQIQKAQEEHQRREAESRKNESILQSIAALFKDLPNHQLLARQRIASQEERKSNLWKRLEELDQEKQVLQHRLRALRQRAVLSIDEVARTEVSLRQLESEHHSAEQSLSQLRHELESHQAEWSTCHAQLEQKREQLLLSMAESNQQANRISSEEQRLVQLERASHELTRRIEGIQEQCEAVQRELSDTSTQASQLELETAEKQRLWQRGVERLQEMRLALGELNDEAAATQAKIHGLAERINVLQDLENQREGIGRGASQLIELASGQPNIKPWNSILGLVADLIEIDIHLAPLVDIALGSAAETVVLADGQVIELLRNMELPLEGKVSLIRMDRLASKRTTDKIQLDGLRGVIGRADRLVKCEEEYQPLVRSLLGSTWLVDSLATALDLSHLRGAGLRFVTASCERIDADGTLTIGALKSTMGLIARKSELISSRQEIEHYRNKLAEQLSAVETAQHELASLEARVRFLDDNSRSSAQALAAANLAKNNLVKRLDEIKSQTNSLENEKHALTAEYGVQIASLQALKERASLVLASVEESKLASEETATRLKELDDRCEAQQQRITQHRIVMAKTEQRLDSQRALLQQSSRDLNERQAAVDDAVELLRSIDLKKADFELQILDATSQLGSLYLELQSVTEQLRKVEVEAKLAEEEFQKARRLTEEMERQLERRRDRLAEHDKELQHLDASLQQLKQRYLEDYQIDLDDRDMETNTPPLEDRNAADSEAALLRQEIAQVGAVNMESLRELDELQSRYDSMDGQYNDLLQARDQLLKIIAKINVDSQRLFLETLDVIRVNFQNLYRKSFGGGHADIILEQGEDVLECGVEIIATPPGKTSLSNSLLSGGEKALTAVALIMAIFQFRPSPFCVLDEVDAPFDEANISRFVTVLKEFLDWTKFIVVTHSKKTMTAANTLYGVTMQENGVSTQVSVRFEDVTDDGHILPMRKAG